MQRLTALLMALLFVLFPVVAQALPTASPEEVGLSKERLGRIAPALARQIIDVPCTSASAAPPAPVFC